jgi:tetratricopeptide (TPR) repeat protein
MVSEANEQAIIDFSSASLLVAELKRGEYEQASIARKAKRQLGREIDKVAGAALASLEQAADTSERYRLEADLLGTMIRSKFKGMKYQPRLEKALKTSLQLDESNANAWVSLAKRPLFALPTQGGDPQLALEHLNRALAVNPQHVQALLFRGTAHAKLGQLALAVQDWATASALNPNTADARDRLMAIEMPAAETKTP